MIGPWSMWPKKIGCWYLLGILFVGCSPSVGPSGNQHGSADPLPRPDPSEPTALRDPETLLQREVLLNDHEQVIGVSVGNQHRAYLIEAFRHPTGPAEVKRIVGSPVVNDFLNGVPLTVTYCDSSHCARVLTNPGEQSLDVKIVGWRDDQLVLRWNEQEFKQRDSRLPLEDYPMLLTTWKDWSELHPDTDVYIGPLDE